MQSNQSQGGSGVGGYDPQNSKVLEAKLAQARALIDPLTKKIPWEHLPKTSRYYNIGAEVLPYLSNSVKMRLLIEHKMAWGGAGHCRKLSAQVFNFLEGHLGFGLSAWEASDDYRSLSKERVATGYQADSLNVEQDSVLEQWLGHYRKFLDKQAKKVGRVAVNLASVPYAAGPKEIKETLETFLGWKGCVSAIDPWWKKDVWVHDGTVTVYLPKVAANQVLDACQEGKFTISAKSSGPSRVIKAWLAKTGSGGSSESTDTYDQGLNAAEDIWG
jgi:hypothetical protein